MLFLQQLGLLERIAVELPDSYQKIADVASTVYAPSVGVHCLYVPSAGLLGPGSQTSLFWILSWTLEAAVSV